MFTFYTKCVTIKGSKIWEVVMRVDKFLSEMGKATRTESAKLARAGKITVN